MRSKKLPDEWPAGEPTYYGTSMREGIEALRKAMEAEQRRLGGSMHDPFFGYRRSPIEDGGGMEPDINKDDERDTLLKVLDTADAALSHPWAKPICSALGKALVVILMPRWMAAYEPRDPQWKWRKALGVAAIIGQCYIECHKAGKK